MPYINAPLYIDKILEEHVSANLDNSAGLTTNKIPYRDWEGKEPRPIYKLPLSYCKFRVDNGRIRGRVKTYEKKIGILKPDDDQTQLEISKFLEQQDPTENNALKSLLKKNGQQQPAIITADGFLINGNRRLWALRKLKEEVTGERFKYIDVVVLPGSGKVDAPTYEDIALLELRLQNQKSGKSEYSGMDKALQTRDYVSRGVLLKEILKDDPIYADMSDKDFNKAMKNFEIDNFDTLKLIDKYLKDRDLDGNYDAVADRWLSFQELNQRVISKFDDVNFLNKHNIDEIDKGLIQAAAFNFIQLKKTADIVPKNINLIRDITTWLKADKKEFLKIGKIPNNNEIKDPVERDAEWQESQGITIKDQVKKLQNLVRKADEIGGPVKRLEEALWCLEHEDLDIQKYSYIPESILKKSYELTKQIENINNGLKRFFFNTVEKQASNKEALELKHKK
jgi:hypothetical protein